MLTTSPEFKANAHHALADAGLQKALAFSKPQFMARRTAAGANLSEFERERDIGREITRWPTSIFTWKRSRLTCSAPVATCIGAAPPRTPAMPCCASAGKPGRGR